MASPRTCWGQVRGGVWPAWPPSTRLWFRTRVQCSSVYSLCAVNVPLRGNLWCNDLISYSCIGRSVNYWHCSHSKRQSLCNGTVSVRLSVLSINRCVAGLLLRARRAADIDRQHRAAHTSTVFISRREQCHVASRRRKLNTDLFALAV